MKNPNETEQACERIRKEREDLPSDEFFRVIEVAREDRAQAQHERQERRALAGLNLQPRQARAAVMLASGLSSSEVGRRLKVSRSTLWTWRRQGAFQRLLRTEEDRALRELRAGLRGVFLASVDVLRQNLSAAPVGEPLTRAEQSRIAAKTLGSMVSAYSQRQGLLVERRREGDKHLEILQDHGLAPEMSLPRRAPTWADSRLSEPPPLAEVEGFPGAGQDSGGAEPEAKTG